MQFIYKPDSFSHSGVKGMKWGVRRYQNKDGSLTSAGRLRYYGTAQSVNEKDERVHAQLIDEHDEVLKEIKKLDSKLFVDKTTYNQLCANIKNNAHPNAQKLLLQNISKAYEDYKSEYENKVRKPIADFSRIIAKAKSNVSMYDKLEYNEAKEKYKQALIHKKNIENTRDFKDFYAYYKEHYTNKKDLKDFLKDHYPNR